MILGEEIIRRETATIYYDPMWNNNVSKFRNVFTQDENLKMILMSHS